MPNASVTFLLKRLRETFGFNNVLPYGTYPDEEDSTGFRIRGIPATFSALTFSDNPGKQLPHGRYDIQIESFPPGYYIYSDEVDLNDFFILIKRIAKDDWPQMS